MIAVTTLEFRTRTGHWLKESQKQPITLTHYNIPSYVVLPIDQYQKLQAATTKPVKHKN